MHEIVIASPSARKTVIKRTGIAHNISIENGEPMIAFITKKTIKVGTNLKIAITTAEIGSMIRGKAVLRISRCPAVIDFTPPVNELATK
jgi:CheY-specific phosphatase CheX